MQRVRMRNANACGAMSWRGAQARRLSLAEAVGVLMAAAIAVSASPASACSVAPGYTAPTNLELAASAHAIVLAEVVGDAVIEAEQGEDRRGISLRPLRMLKGLMPQDALLLPGMALSPEGAFDPSDPLELAAPHPDSFAGSCIRRSFTARQVALFFLNREDGFWRPAGGAFSRWAEDVVSEDAPWLALAGLYTHAARLSAAEQRAMLEDQEEALRARADDDVAQVMADDIARQLAGLDRALLPQTAPPEPVAALSANPAEAPAQSSVEAALDAMGARPATRP